MSSLRLVAFPCGSFSGVLGLQTEAVDPAAKSHNENTISMWQSCPEFLPLWSQELDSFTSLNSPQQYKLTQFAQLHYQQHPYLKSPDYAPHCLL